MTTRFENEMYDRYDRERAMHRREQLVRLLNQRRLRENESERRTLEQALKGLHASPFTPDRDIRAQVLVTFCR
jgi:hypothetical protein